MSKLRTAIEKLPAKAKEYCEYQQTHIRKYKASGQKEFWMEETKKLRGYLQCLKDLEIITYTDMQSLYLFYCTM